MINRWLVGALIVLTPFSATAHASSGDQQTTTTTTTVLEAVSFPVPKQSGVGRRVVYANQEQRVLSPHEQYSRWLFHCFSAGEHGIFVEQ